MSDIYICWNYIRSESDYWTYAVAYVTRWFHCQVACVPGMCTANATGDEFKTFGEVLARVEGPHEFASGLQCEDVLDGTEERKDEIKELLVRLLDCYGVDQSVRDTALKYFDEDWNGCRMPEQP
eukprot:GFYU01043485.1.p1 GENE.GFYU01043485.1~~GFYU01043485.1.p1  ORF type:complete len:124 (+),score=20.12 GFYU01043485.1:290-661(+)